MLRGTIRALSGTIESEHHLEYLLFSYEEAFAEFSDLNHLENPRRYTLDDFLEEDDIRPPILKKKTQSSKDRLFL